MVEQHAHALVTGASAGLGAGFARALAERGRDLVLVARREERLVELGRELASRHGVEARHVALDLARPDGPQELERWCADRGIEVDLLVNNAGFGAQGRFVDLDRERQLELLRLNVVAATDIAHRFGALMARRGRGAILNVASTASFMPGPGMAAYYASKAYVLSLSEALAAELRPRGVVVTALCPGPTETEFRAVAGRPRSAVLDSVAMQPEPVVRAALAALDRGRAVCVPGWFNVLCAQSVRFLPRALVRAIVARIQLKDPV